MHSLHLLIYVRYLTQHISSSLSKPNYYNTAKLDLNDIIVNESGSLKLAPIFVTSCNNVRLDKGVLYANCAKLDGSEHASTFDLNTTIGNIDGKFKWGAANFLV